MNYLLFPFLAFSMVIATAKEHPHASTKIAFKVIQEKRPILVMLGKDEKVILVPEMKSSSVLRPLKIRVNATGLQILRKKPEHITLKQLKAMIQMYKRVAKNTGINPEPSIQIHSESNDQLLQAVLRILRQNAKKEIPSIAVTLPPKVKLPKAKRLPTRPIAPKRK